MLQERSCGGSVPWARYGFGGGWLLIFLFLVEGKDECKIVEVLGVEDEG